jgi:hypothetical protein
LAITFGPVSLGFALAISQFLSLGAAAPSVTLRLVSLGLVSLGLVSLDCARACAIALDREHPEADSPDNDDSWLQASQMRILPNKSPLRENISER